MSLIRLTISQPYLASLACALRRTSLIIILISAVGFFYLGRINVYTYLKGDIKIERQIIFLCGPYFNKNNENDRRNVLLKFLKETYDDNVIPLIIDDFLISDNILDDNINIQLLEEIFAAISTCTYIFLDTMSAASELGLFASHTTQNNIHVLLPYSSDILDKKVGYFVKNIIIGQNKDKIKLNYYRPKILKQAIATDYVIEHYEFIDNKIPNEIKDTIRKMPVVLEGFVTVKYDSSIPNIFGYINYIQNENSISAKISMQTLFYLVASTTYNNFTKTQLKDKTIDKCEIKTLDGITENIKSIILRTIDIHIAQDNYNKYNIEIETNIKKDFYQIIKHIQKFIALYHENEPRNGHLFITKSNNQFLKNSVNDLDNSLEVLSLTKDDYTLIENINKNQNKLNNYFKEFTFTKNRKKRQFYKYNESEYGDSARKLHKKLHQHLEKHFIFSDYSFAYQKGKSIVKCLEKHLESVHFIKFDIKSFFNNINIHELCSKLLLTLSIDNSYFDRLIRILDTCSVEKSIQLGLSISPILSEIYMSSFDEELGKFVEIEDLVYTRYADDILISSRDVLSEEKIIKINNCIKDNLKLIGLKINNSKYRTGTISAQGHHFKYLGINIVQTNQGRKLTVGKSYKNYVAKRYLKYLNISENDTKYESTRFYESKRISGQLAFIKQVEGMDGYSQVINRISKSTKGKVTIIDSKITF